MFENVPAVSSLERQQLVAALDRLQSKLVQREEWTHSDNMRNLKETLQSPLFNHILTLQCSIKQLRHQGRQTELVRLSRPASGGLGFSVVGLNPGGSSCQGVFVKHVQPGGVAHRSGGLQEKDQILVINGRALESGVSQQEALSLLQSGDSVELVVARETSLNAERTVNASQATERALNSALLQPPNIDTSQWGHVEQIELVNDGSGLGFGIVGGKSGIVVRTLLPNSVAHRFFHSVFSSGRRLRTGDHILSIGSAPTADLSSEQVVSALQACGSRLNGVSLHGRTNQEVLEVMKQTGQTVVLTLVRKKRALERSLDKVERGESRVSLKRSLELKSRSLSRQEHDRNSNRVSASDAALRAKWEQALGPNYKVLVVNLDPVIEDDEELQKSSKLLPVHTVRLGVELDSFDGHHYVSSVIPEGPVDKHGELRPEDELLEVNDVQVYGKSRREVIAFLKEVPPPFTLACCRLLAADQDLYQDQNQNSDLDSDAEEEPPPKYQPQYNSRFEPEPKSREENNLDEIELKLSSMLCQTETRERLSLIQQELSSSPELPVHSDSPSEDGAGVTGVTGATVVTGEDSSDEDEEEELAMWSPEILPIELNKDPEKGLGFSILDYQDPLDPGRCVMVVRSLVQGGSAERSGRLLPGDQLVRVNSTELCDMSLSEAVDVLKTAPAGRVRLGVRKPLISLEDIQVEPFASNLDDDNEPELILDGGLPRYSSATPVTSDLSPAAEGQEMAVDEEVTQSKNTQDEREHRAPPPSWDEWRRSLGRAKGQRSERQSQMSWKMLCFSGKSFAVVDSSEADSELTLTDTDTESVRVVNADRRRRRGHAGTYPPTRGAHSDLPEREDGEGEETPAFSHWEPPRRVEVWVEPGQSLGLSIVGGRHVIKRLRNGEELKGIFIKQVLSHSPAAKTQSLKTGDKILE
ncbi:hypothetical protein WMY93_024958 [Mugilogobius chulae]|uniref:InaD-like protein n=1 Tax=Mugilogobius chulae TaxID=88201 RepID=A0AAW0N2R1_9GOBI